MDEKVVEHAKQIAELLAQVKQKRWLTTEDFEEEFKVGYKTQEKMRKERRMPFSKFGGRVYYDRKLIDKTLEEHIVETRDLYA